MEVSEITYLIIFGTVAFLAFFIFIGVVVIRYYKKNKEYIEKTIFLRQNFERNLLQSQIETQEQTFNTISQEIHDSVGQLLSLAKVQLSIAEQHENVDKALLADVKSTIGKALTDLRDIAKSLNSNHIRQLTLPEIIQEDLQRINKLGVIKCYIETEGNELTVPEQKKAILFRIVQESLQNILKHAEATQIIVAINFMEQNLKITISDNGKGFDTKSEAIKPSGLGLNNLKNRITLLNGSADINSKPGEGTVITLNMPYA